MLIGTVFQEIGKNNPTQAFVKLCDGNWLLFIYKVQKENMPTYINTQLNWPRNIYTMRSSDFLLLDVPPTNTYSGKLLSVPWLLPTKLPQSYILNIAVTIGQFRVSLLLTQRPWKTKKIFYCSAINQLE